ncbi:hypothetical protein ACET8K_10990 [Aeromonas veronii]|uniref:hypothetical protein n=1 Tax=Aeromonas veronii TaxID=654 RepID=UPI0038D8A786
MSNQSRSNSTPLLPLEYCSPERAARLLGCEVEDIFHWATVGAITLFAEFYEYDFDAEISDGFYADVNYGMGIYDPEHLEWIPSNDGDFFYQLGLEDNDDFEINIGPVGFQYGARLQISGLPRTILAEGLFAIDTASIQQWLHESPTEMPFRNWNLSALYAGENERDCYLNAIDLDRVTVSDIPKRFRVVRADMLKIRDHMLTGELMPSHAIVRHNNSARASTSGSEPPRITANQSKAIVDLLKTLGYTLDDLQGSAEALQQKIARNGHSTQLSSVTPKTLRAWLDRADAR